MSVHKYLDETGLALVWSKINNALNLKINKEDIPRDVLTKTNTTSYTPTGDYNPATKKYVDDTIADNSDIMVINYDGETSDKTFLEIYSHINNGGIAILIYLDCIYHLYSFSQYGIEFRLINTADDSSEGIYATFSFCVHISNQNEVTYDEIWISSPKESISTPLMNGTASVGVSYRYAHGDHVHPTDTTRAAVSDVLTKTNTTSYTPTANYHPATKKYVDDSIPESNVLLVNMTYDNDTLTVDKTLEEVSDAFSDGKVVYLSNSAIWNGYEFVSFQNIDWDFYLTYYTYSSSNYNSTTLTEHSYWYASQDQLQSYAHTYDVLTKTNTTSYTPTADYHPATKQYVDDKSDDTFIINLSSSGSGDNITYSFDKTYSEIENAYNAGKKCVVIETSGNSKKYYYYLSGYDYNSGFYFSCVNTYSSLLFDVYTLFFSVINNTIYKNYHNVPNFEYIKKNIAGSSIISNKNTNTSDGSWNTSTATKAYSKDDIFLINYNKFVKATTDIASGATLTKNTNYVETTIADELELKADVANVLTKTNTTSYTPTSDYHPATKKYVDDNISSDIYYFTWSSARNNVVTYDEVKAEHDAGKVVYAIDEPFVYRLTNANNYAMGFVGNFDNRIIRYAWTKSDNTITHSAYPILETNISSPTTGQLLAYNSTSSKWENITLNTVTETRVNELIQTALAQYGDGDTASYGFEDASEVNY